MGKALYSIIPMQHEHADAVNPLGYNFLNNKIYKLKTGVLK
jgi:hypothetical protein